MTAVVRNEKTPFSVLLYCMLLALSPWPIFFDLSSFSIVISRDFWDVRLAIPIPIGFFAVIAAFMIGKLYCLMGSRKFIQVNFSVVESIFVVVFGLIIVSQKFTVGLAVERIVQTFSPIIVVIMISFPAQHCHQVLAVRSVFFSICLLLSTHFISVMISSKGALPANAIYDFSFYFEFLIYQSLISYSGFLSLAFIFLFGILFHDLNRITPNRVVLKNMFNGWIVIMLCMTLILGATGARRAFMLEILAAITWISLGLLVLSAYRLRIDSRQCRCGLFLLLFWVSAMFAIWKTNIMNRFLDSFTTSGYDPGRVETYARGLGYLSEHWTQLLFGLGSLSNPGFHNSWIDLLYRVGMVGTTLIIIFVARHLYIIFTKITKSGNRVNLMSFMPPFFICVALQTFVNSTLFLPYYLINVVTIFMLLATIEKKNIKE